MRAATGHNLHGRRLDLGAAKIQSTHLVAAGTGHIQDASQGVGACIGRTITEENKLVDCGVPLEVYVII